MVTAMVLVPDAVVRLFCTVLWWQGVADLGCHYLGLLVIIAGKERGVLWGGRLGRGGGRYAKGLLRRYAAVLGAC